jgi:hypothetical protein
MFYQVRSPSQKCKNVRERLKWFRGSSSEILRRVRQNVAFIFITQMRMTAGTAQTLQEVDGTRTWHLWTHMNSTLRS